MKTYVGENAERAPTTVSIPPIRSGGGQSGLGIDYEDSESEHGDTDEETVQEQSEESNTDEETDDDNDGDDIFHSNDDDDDIFNSDDEEDDDKRKKLQKIKVGETVINLITEVILPYLNELK